MVMKLKEIEKSIYRKRLNIIIVAFIGSLLALALVYGQILIALFAEPIVTEALKEGVTQDSNFRYNFIGVVMALLTCVLALHRLRHSEFFNEVYYVWQVKQQQNYIFRKLKAIKKAAENDEINALIILNFYYTSLKQVYLLDDNTLTMSKLTSDINLLNEQLTSKNLTVSTEQYEKSLLAKY